MICLNQIFNLILLREKLKIMTEKELTTEEKILLSASKVFTEKGFAGTRTRDIACLLYTSRCV